jgi:sugar/nucleoside kinase (ribokinase family)
MRKGIISAGNWIIDHVKIIDTWPKRGMLANIKSKMLGTGGAPYNVLIDLAKLETGIPLFALGVIGNDSDGEYILKDLKKHHIDTKYMKTTEAQPTSYTDVMTEADTGYRTFFHCRGANALLDYEHFKVIETNAKIFHLGYLLLLDKLDSEDKEYGVVAARVLDMLHKKGYKTSVDVVSEASDRFRKIVTPCLKYIDYLIVNEIEAGETTGLKIRRDDKTIDNDNLVKSAKALLSGGVKELVTIHFPEAGYAITKKGESVFSPSFVVDKEEIKGTVGAGDAFCAGMLYGLHEDLPIHETLTIANANARFNLLSPTCTNGAVDIESVRKYIATAKLHVNIFE